MTSQAKTKLFPIPRKTKKSKLPYVSSRVHKDISFEGKFEYVMKWFFYKKNQGVECFVCVFFFSYINFLFEKPSHWQIPSASIFFFFNEGIYNFKINLIILWFIKKVNWNVKFTRQTFLMKIHLQFFFCQTIVFFKLQLTFGNADTFCKITNGIVHKFPWLNVWHITYITPMIII